MIMASAKDRGAADQTAGAAREGMERASDTAGKVAGAAQERTQHAVDEWSRGVKEGLTRYQEMFSQMPGVGVNGGDGEARTIAREQLVEFNTELLSYAQGSLNEAFEASKAVINAANLQEAMQIQVSYTRKAMEEAVEHAKTFSDLYAKASREVKGASETEKQARHAG